MPMDPAIADLMATGLISDTRESARLSGVADRNLTQGGGIIHNVLIQQNGGVADDAATFAALRTAIHVPKASSEST